MIGFIFSANAIGIMIGNLVSPVIVKHANDIPKMVSQMKTDVAKTTSCSC